MLLEFEDKNRRLQRNTVKEEKGNFVSKDLLKNCFVTEHEINVMVGQVRNEISKDLKVQAYFCNNFFAHTRIIFLPLVFSKLSIKSSKSLQ